MAGFTRRRDIYVSKVASDITSETINVADIEDEISVQIIGANSVTTLQGSNATGYDVAIAEADWSHITCVIGPQLVAVEPGFRYLRAQRSVSTQVVISGWYRT